MLKVRIKSDPENDIKVEGDVGIEEDYLDSIPKGILSLINWLKLEGWSVKNTKVGFRNVIKNCLSRLVNDSTVE